MATGNMIPAYVNEHWKTSGMWQLKVEDEAICQHICNVYLRYIKMRLVNGVFHFASVDIRMNQMLMLFSDCNIFHGRSHNQFEVRSIPTVEVTFNLEM